MTRIAENVSQLIGSTPLVRINKVAGTDVDVVAKVEAFNPASSVKDRIAAAIIDAAEASGDLQPGGTIIEATSGNTGIALAMVGAARGYKVVIVMPASMSKERRTIVRAFGAELVLTDPKGGVSAAVAQAQRIRDERPGSIIASQFTNPANPQIHQKTTAEEIWADTDGQIDVFVAGVGTGGTISGVARILKERNPQIRIIAVQPSESPLLTGGQAAPHGIQGLMPNFIPDTYNASVIDEVVSVTSSTALEFARRAAAEEGLLVGISSGAALAGTAEVAAREEFAGKKIVTLLPDTGERYLSTKLFEDLQVDD
ncbi:cysteine synthase A [Schaalia sp. ZJ405]|uniref:cysteine synthase A n=1 Tax=unclassified Schaalia TaxID=2691889 RepID=UPI0013ED63C9|nr:MULTISPECIES: cysteine synthase A [unclassified Schaalia]QPK80587.1 cysteine synthase A [Schaalia sp. ZJ405]